MAEEQPPDGERPNSGTDQGGTDPGDIAGRLESLGAEVRQAKADALLRHRASEPVRRRRRLVFAGSLTGALAVVGVTAGLALADSGSSGPGRTAGTSRAPVEVYLADHVTSGTPIGVIGAPGAALPAGYHRVELAVSNLSQAAGLHYAVGPDPITAAGPALAAFVGRHATLVATDPGRATLWVLHAAGSTPTTVAPTTVAPTTVAPATGPGGSAAPGATIGPAGSAAPATGTPSGSAPARATTWVVRPGDSFWSIATAEQTARLGGPPAAAQVAGYWSRLVTANLDRLPRPGDTNVIFPGQTLLLPG